MVPSPCNSGGHGGALNVFSVSDSSQNRERQRFPAPAVAAAAATAATAAEGGTSRGLLLVLPARRSRRWRRNAWESHVSGRAQVWAPTWRSWLVVGGGVVTRWHGNNTHPRSLLLQGPSLIFLLFDNSKKPDLSAPSIISSRQPVCFPNKIRSRILEVHNFHSLSPESHKRMTHSQPHIPETPASLPSSETLYSILAVLHHHQSSLPCPSLPTLNRLPEV